MSDAASKIPQNIDELLRWSTQFLTAKGFQTARLDSELLLAKVLDCRRIDLYLRFDQPMSKAELSSYKSLLLRRLNHEPVAYILGYKDFMDLRFEVDKSVLIPRPETELLVERILEFFKNREEEDLRIFEIGSGSGCIGITLLNSLKNAKLLAWDISQAAVNLSSLNARKCQIESSRYQFQVRDALDEKSWIGLQNFDIIVSNPPYIAIEEREQLPSSVALFEPGQALFAHEEGLSFYRLFAKLARYHLHETGKMFVEIGSNQAVAVSSILNFYGWQDVLIKKDYARHDRIVEGAYSGNKTE